MPAALANSPSGNLTAGGFPSAGKFRESLPVVAVVLSFWPVWRWYGMRLNDGSDEPWGLAALAIASTFIWQHRSALRITAAGTFGAALLIVAYAAGFNSLPALIRAGLAITAIGILTGLHRAPAGIWGLLALSLPVVATAQFFAGWPLRVMTAAGAEFLLHGFGYEAIRQGTVLHWQNVPVAVDPPCSGIRMLWAGLFVHFALATLHRLRWRTLLWLTPLAVGAIILVNTLRATLLFFKESGIVSLPEWTHSGIGLALFGLFLAGPVALYPKLARKAAHRTTDLSAENGINRRGWTGFFTVCFLAAATPWLAGGRSDPSPENSEIFPGWPDAFEGGDLHPLPLSKQEHAFAEDFPGRLGAFQDSNGRKIILRWITRPTRKLHSSADCLRAAGFTIEKNSHTGLADPNWARWSARHPDHGNFSVREQLHSAEENSDAAWTEVSAWFWAAFLNRTSGPWWAVTVIEPAADPST